MLGIIIQLDTDTSSNNNHLPSHEKSIIKKKEKERKYKNVGELDQNPHVNKNDT